MSQHNSNRPCPNCGLDNDADAIYCGGCKYKFTQYGIDSTTNIKSAPPTPVDNWIGTIVPPLNPHLATPKKRITIRVVFFTVLILLIVGTYMLARIGQGGDTTASKNTGTTSAAGTVLGSGNTQIPGNTTPTAAIPSPTPVPPTPTPTPVPTGKGCTYDTSTGWADWQQSFPDGWHVVNNEVEGNGNGDQSIQVPSTCQMTSADYSVKARIKALNAYHYFLNFIVRANAPDDGYIASAWFYNGDMRIFAGQKSAWPIASGCCVSSDQYINYEIQVKGNTITFKANGSVVTVTDNTYYLPGNVYFESTGVQFSMQSFSVQPL